MSSRRLEICGLVGLYSVIFLFRFHLFTLLDIRFVWEINAH